MYAEYTRLSDFIEISRLPVPANEIPLYDALLQNRVKNPKNAVHIFIALDKILLWELGKYWEFIRQVVFSQHDRNREREYDEQRCPVMYYWRRTVHERLRDATLAKQMMEFEYRKIYAFADAIDSVLRQDHLIDLLKFYHRAFFTTVKVL